jgi:hypothetical protein
MPKTELNEILLEPMKGGGHCGNRGRRSKSKNGCITEKRSKSNSATRRNSKKNANNTKLTKQMLLGLQKFMLPMLPANLQASTNSKPNYRSKTQKRSA